MLVITRKVGESIEIDGSIVLTVSSVEGNRVKIAFEAQKVTRIIRSEIRDRSRRDVPEALPQLAAESIHA